MSINSKICSRVRIHWSADNKIGILISRATWKNNNQKLKTYNKEQNDMISCLYEMSNSRDKQGISLEYMMKVVPEMRTNLDNYVGITVTVSIHLLVDY